MPPPPIPLPPPPSPTWSRKPPSPRLPPGRRRRFDARFFLADAEGATGDLETFAGATDELSHLHWIGLAEARALDLPFITEVVLAEVTAILRGADQPGVPFFDNSTDTPTFRRLV